METTVIARDDLRVGDVIVFTVKGTRKFDRCPDDMGVDVGLSNPLVASRASYVVVEPGATSYGICKVKDLEIGDRFATVLAKCYQWRTNDIFLDYFYLRDEESDCNSYYTESCIGIRLNADEALEVAHRGGVS
jgi:hypothetical protein